MRTATNQARRVYTARIPPALMSQYIRYGTPLPARFKVYSFTTHEPHATWKLVHYKGHGNPDLPAPVSRLAVQSVLASNEWSGDNHRQELCDSCSSLDEPIIIAKSSVIHVLHWMSRVVKLRLQG